MSPQEFINLYNQLFSLYTHIAMDVSGLWWVFQMEPEYKMGTWERVDGFAKHTNMINANIKYSGTAGESLRKAE